MNMARTSRLLALLTVAALVAGCAATQQAVKPPSAIEGRYVRIELQDGTSYPVEKVDQLYLRVAWLLGIKRLNGESRPTVVVTTPDAIRQLYQVNGAGHYMNGLMPLAGYVDGKILAWGYDAPRLARMLAYHLAFQYLKADASEAERLAARVEDRITWETMNPFSSF